MEFYKGKTVYITGGSSGIGLATAKLLASYGANVAIFARRKQKLDKALKEISGKKASDEQRFYSLAVDISNEKVVKKQMDKAVKEFGTPDILINNAGNAYCNYFEKTTAHHLDDIMKSNLYGTWHCTAVLLPHMKKNNGGKIINIASVAGLIGTFGYSAYGSSKFALVGFSECLRNELFIHNIDVKVFCPADTDTPQLHEEDKTKPDETRAISGTIKVSKPEDVAQELLKGITSKKFMLVHGFMGKISYLAKRIWPGLVYLIMDSDVKKVQKKKK